MLGLNREQNRVCAHANPFVHRLRKEDCEAGATLPDGANLNSGDMECYSFQYSHSM